MSIMLNIQSRVPPHDFGEKHPENPHGYVPKRSKNDFFWGELSNSGGLIDSKMSVQRASPMVTFCEWATEDLSDDPHVVKLAKTIEIGLKRVKGTLAAADH